MSLRQGLARVRAVTAAAAAALAAPLAPLAACPACAGQQQDAASNYLLMVGLIVAVPIVVGFVATAIVGRLVRQGTGETVES